MDRRSVARSPFVPDGRGMRNRLRVAFISAALTIVVLGVGAPTASAGLLVKSAPDCTPKPATKAFAPWGDGSDYNLAPGGGFESGTAGWTLGGRASVVSGNEPWKVSGAGTRSLKLPPGGVATSPVVCVGLEHPTLRFFVKDNRALLSTMTVSVITETSLGLTLEVPVGVVLPGGAWRPSPKFLVVANLLPLLPGEHTPVQFRLRSVGLGTWNVDDFYVDPRCR
jgi:hypothetical protein